MSGHEINVVLAFLHIVSAIGWMGATISLDVVGGQSIDLLSGTRLKTARTYSLS